MPDLALVSCVAMPEPDHDEVPLLEALRVAGIDAEIYGWNDHTRDWSRPRLSIIRSTWDYVWHYRDFLAWVDHVDEVGRLLNPRRVVLRNAHKSYLNDLHRAGVPTVPTALVRSGEDASLVALLEDRGWGEVVVKPAVSAGSWDTTRVGVAERDRGEEWFQRLKADRDVLVQPYLSSVETHGERSLIQIDGVFTHSIRKTPRWHDGEETVSTALGIADVERRIAELALATVADDLADDELLYARVDVARDARGELVVMELELIEPSLFLKQSPVAMKAFVDAVARRL